MKVLLVQPTEFRKGLLDSFFLFSPLPLETVAGSLKKDYDTRIIDLRLSDDPEKDFIQAFETFAPDVVAATALTLTAHSAFQALQWTKRLNPATLTVIGGQHVSLNPQSFQSPCVDVITVGEGDNTFREILETVELQGRDMLGPLKGISYRNGIAFSQVRDRPLCENLDNLPFPARRLTEQDQDQYALLNKKKWLFLESARGCPFRCDFCAVWKLHQSRCRFKSPERTVAEIESVAERVETVFFADDNFFVDLDRTREIARLLSQKNLRLKYYVQARPDTIADNVPLIDTWREVGLEGVYLGFEECDPEIMKSIGAAKSTGHNLEAVRILRERSIFSLGSFIVSPNFSKEDFFHLRNHIDVLNASMLTFYVLTPYPGTSLYERERNALCTRDYRLFDGIHAVLPTKLHRDEFYEEFASLFQQFWTRSNKDYLLWKMPAGRAAHWYKRLKHLNRDHDELKDSFYGVPWA